MHGKQFQKQTKCLILFMEIMLYLIRISVNGLQDAEGCEDHENELKAVTNETIELGM
jgi:hypothetical protein